MVNSDVAYNPGVWSSFLSVEVSASAALTGLLFVAASINLARIIANPLLTARLAKALSTLVGVLFGASLCLVPGQSMKLLGGELVLVGVLIWIMITVSERVSSRKNPYMSSLAKTFHAILAQGSGIPLIACGGSLLLGGGGGLYWMVVGVIISFAAALLDAWVLLIEIQR